MYFLLIWLHVGETGVNCNILKFAETIADRAAKRWQECAAQSIYKGERSTAFSPQECFSKEWKPIYCVQK